MTSSVRKGEAAPALLRHCAEGWRHIRSLTALKPSCWQESQISPHGETHVETPGLHEKRDTQPSLSCFSP